MKLNCCAVLCILVVFLALPEISAAEKKTDESALDSVYRGYKPDFMHQDSRGRYRIPMPGRGKMELSAEKTFYSMSFVEISSRADALVEAGVEKEKNGDFRLAIDIYQQVIDNFPETLYRISPYGVYVPVSHYCQMRILEFPQKHLAFYREKNDSKARELFEISKERNSLEGLARIRDNMLCTSYGAKSMLVLGNAELDRGHYLAALEYFRTVRDNFPEKEVHTPELNLKIVYCRKMLGDKVSVNIPSDLGNSKLDRKKLQSFVNFVKSSRPEKQGLVFQQRCPSHISSDDYAYMIPTQDPLGIQRPVWAKPKSGGGLSVETQAVITEKSVIYRHLNIIYCRSILNGELRWKNALGGRVSWQSYYRNRAEDILVHDGMVFTPMHKNGPTLMAFDEITGQLKWSYGPMSASTAEEATTYFRAAPAGGPSEIYAGYVYDNIGSGVHIDSEYGVLAFESRTGRVKWKKAICRLRPGKFAVSFGGGGVRRRIRSFASPPLYHQGTVYYCTNAGSMAALDALSGRVKWLMKYPYYSYPHDIHDATRGFGKGSDHMHPPSPMLWFNKPPLIVGDGLYLTPADSAYMFKLDRRTGKVLWTRKRLDQTIRQHYRSGCGCGGGGHNAYFMGPLKTGELLFVYAMNGRGRYNIKKPDNRNTCPGGIVLLNPKNGGITWASSDPVLPNRDHPSLYLGLRVENSHNAAVGYNNLKRQITARPFLSADNKLYICSIRHGCFPVYGTAVNLAELDLSKRTFTKRRTYYDDVMIKTCEDVIRLAPGQVKKFEALPKHVKKDKKIKQQLKGWKRIAQDTVPVNEHPRFMPFSRVTFRKYGTVFELRLDPGRISMVYNRDRVKQTVTAGSGPESTFAASELALAEKRYEHAAGLMESCLKRISPEDIGFRSLVNQQLFRVYRTLAQGSIRRSDTDSELGYVTGMSRTSTTLADEIQTLFAISDVYGRKREYVKASQYLQGLISKYGSYRYGVSSLYTRDRAAVESCLGDIVRRTSRVVKGSRYGQFMQSNMSMMEKSLPLYYSAVSPAERDLKVRCEQVAVSRLLSMQESSGKFRSHYEKDAGSALGGRQAEEQLARLVEFPGTQAGQKVLEELLQKTEAELSGADTAKAAHLRKRLWRLADTARLCRFTLPDRFRKQLCAPAGTKAASLSFPLAEKKRDMEEARGPSWLVLDRRGERSIRPGLIFLGARVKKKFDNKFLLYAIDAGTGEVVWKATEQRGKTRFDEIRLKGKGNEAGFSEAFVHRDTVVVHGLFDVLAFNLSDGRLRWRYRVPFNFDIRYALKSGNLLVLSGESETVVLHLSTKDPVGEVAWQEKEQGDPYGEPWFSGNRLVSVRKMPFSVTVRYRSTGKLIGRLEMDDLMLRQDHPLLTSGPRAYPLAHDGTRLAVCGGGYYHMLDIQGMRTVWKRLMDVDRNTPVRMELRGDYLAVVKKDYDIESIYMLSSRTGQVLWRTDPKDPGGHIPMYSMFIRRGRLYGIRKHPGQGFYFSGVDCKTGRDIFRKNNQEGYNTAPSVRLRRELYGGTLAAEIRDRQDFELKAFDIQTGRLKQTVRTKGLGRFGEHGRASATVQNGTMILHGKNTVKICSPGGT